MNDRIILQITPQPYVKTLPNESKLFYIPERCHYIPSLGRHRRKGESVDVRLLGCELWNNTGFCRHTSSIHTRRRKKRIIRYNDYKKDIKRLCDEQGLTLQVCGWSLYFYFPMPVRWSKTKKQRMRGQMKLSKGDLDNYIKGIFDSLGKRRGDGSQLMPDECVAQLSGTGKFWIDAENGYIEVLLNQPLYNPFGVTFINQR